MVLQNYVILQEGIPARLHFVDHEIQTREVTDPVSGRPKTVRALVLHVDQLNGVPALAQYSTISEKHALQFQPYLEGKKYKDYTFTITQLGRGFTREYRFEVSPVPKS